MDAVDQYRGGRNEAEELVGSVKRKLDFVVVGAQKSGTTTLYEYLRRHPELCLPAAKEVPYFSHDANYARDWGEYLRKAFPFADEGNKWGTVTPHYMVGGLYEPGSPDTASDERTVPERIHRLLPDVRLIAILRDPVERARSHHAMAAMNEWDKRPFVRAVEELLDPAALREARRYPSETTGYVVWGEYGRILSGYLDVFEREQLLVLYSSELKQDPDEVLRRVFAFLDVDSDFVPDNLGASYRAGATTRRLRWLDLSAWQATAASSAPVRGLWHALPERARRRIDRRFDEVNYRTELWNRRAIESHEADDEPALEALRAHYEADADRLTSLLGDAPAWSRSAAVG
jgi:hypothetical protein